jgi:hypothetical protein
MRLVVHRYESLRVILTLGCLMQSSGSRTYLLALALLGAGGCATPQDVKDASTAQLKLIDALDAAAKSLNEGLDQYADDQADLVRQERRVNIARVAIDTALSGQAAEARVTFVDVLALSKERVRKSVDLTMYDPTEIDSTGDQIKKLQEQISTMPDGPDKSALQATLNQLRRKKAAYDSVPNPVKEQEKAERDALALPAELRSAADQGVGGLRLQIAVMKELATHVDTWLKIDLTPSQQQVDGVEKTFSELIGKLNGIQQ